MKKVIKLTESDLMRLVKRVIKEQNEVDESSFTFGDKIKGKLGKMVGIPETTDDEMRLADDILSVVERGDYEVLDTYTGSHMRPKGHKIKVSLGDGDYIVKIAQERRNPVSGTMTYTNVTTPDGEDINILAKGFTNKLIDLIDDSDRGKRFRYPKNN
jgi:hypothetical protein